MTLQEAVALALKQNPDLLLARLDQQKARYQVTIVHDPFAPKVFAGSGAAYTYGYPRPSMARLLPSPVTCLHGSLQPSARVSGSTGQGKRRMAPSLIRPAGRKKSCTAWPTVFLSVEQTTHSLEAAARRIESLTRVADLTAQRVAEGRELPLESKKANLAVLRAQQQWESLRLDLEPVKRR